VDKPPLSCGMTRTWSTSVTLGQTKNISTTSASSKHCPNVTIRICGKVGCANLLPAAKLNTRHATCWTCSDINCMGGATSSLPLRVVSPKLLFCSVLHTLRAVRAIPPMYAHTAGSLPPLLGQWQSPRTQASRCPNRLPNQANTATVLSHRASVWCPGGHKKNVEILTIFLPYLFSVSG